MTFGRRAGDPRGLRQRDSMPRSDGMRDPFLIHSTGLLLWEGEHAGGPCKDGATLRRLRSRTPDRRHNAVWQGPGSETVTGGQPADRCPVPDDPTCPCRRAVTPHPMLGRGELTRSKMRGWGTDASQWGGAVPSSRRSFRRSVPERATLARVSFGAAGHYQMEPESLARFRAAVADEAKGRELEKILSALSKKGYSADTHEGFKRVPKGFAPDHPRAELLKRRGLVAHFPALPPGILAEPKLAKWLSSACKTAAPLVEWLTFATA